MTDSAGLPYVSSQLCITIVDLIEYYSHVWPKRE